MLDAIKRREIRANRSDPRIAHSGLRLIPRSGLTIEAT
jgi:hypothetical protein